VSATKACMRCGKPMSVERTIMDYDDCSNCAHAKADSQRARATRTHCVRCGQKLFLLRAGREVCARCVRGLPPEPEFRPGRCTPDGSDTHGARQ